jgi:quinol monooxygenase YgiN
MISRMSSKPLTVVAHLRAKPGQEENLRRELLALISTTRQEPGCVNYDLHQGADDAALFLFHENWTSKQHLDAHLNRPHLKTFLAKADLLLSEPPRITLWQMIS